MGTAGPVLSELWDQRVAVARACRVLAHRGLVEDVLGHISLRVGPDRALLRCRGPRESGLRFTQPDDIRLVDVDGAIIDGGEHGGEHGGEEGWSTPTEAPIHVETLRRHPHVQCVVHAHPPAVVVAGLAAVPLVPVFGSYDIPAARLAAAGIPIYERSVLIRDATTAAAMLSAMGEASVVVLRGHGLVTSGSSVGEAVVRAIAIDRLCRIALRIVHAGATPTSITGDDLAALPDLGAALNTDAAWRFHLAALAADGWDLSAAEISEGRA